ncbi:hypothetical protein ABIF66_004678 [Bradyrhizobium japonicum]
MLGYKGPAQPSPTIGDAINAGYLYLEVRCLGCATNQTVALDIIRRAKTTPVHELERYLRCKDCSAVRAGPGCLDSAPLDLSGFLPGYAERGALRFCRCVGRA